MPGSLMLWLETEMASEATTKNQPPDMDIIMFHAWEVKMAKMAAHSTPSRLLGNRAMKLVTVMERKPSTGIDWRMSSMGTSTFSAARYLEARAANTQANSIDAPRAMNIRKVVRSR